MKEQIKTQYKIIILGILLIIVTIVHFVSLILLIMCMNFNKLILWLSILATYFIITYFFNKYNNNLKNNL